MKIIISQFCFFFICSAFCFAQTNNITQDTSINNLVHKSGYNTSTLGEIPKFIKAGNGGRTLIIIPGLGFDASVFTDFIEENLDTYTMYVITIPGYGETNAPPMPPDSISYGEQSWNKGVLEGLAQLIDKEKIRKPIIVGHFVQGIQLAVMMSVEYPQKVGGLILMGGPAKFIGVMNEKIIDNPKDKMILFTDKYTGPVWFKHMEKKYFDDNNFLPAIYSLNNITGDSLWKQSARVQLPVAIRYTCEYFASDVRADFDKIKCPVLVLRAMLDSTVLHNPINNYLKPQFIDSWDDATHRNSLITVQDIKDAGCFIWKDKPKETYSAIKDFILSFPE